MSESATVQARVRAFLDAGPRFAQLITVSADGTPVTRTVGARVCRDWSVELVARAAHARIRQLAANPRLQLVFVCTPTVDEPVAHPAVIDYGLPIPRVVALSGRAEPMTPAETLASYRRQTEHSRSAGHTRAPVRDDEDVRADLVGTRMRVDRVRAEGFGDGALAVTWNPTNPPVGELRAESTTRGTT